MCTRLPSGTKRRWDSIFRYTLNAGTFPVTPIITRPLAISSPIDGNHRLVRSLLQTCRTKASRPSTRKSRLSNRITGSALKGTVIFRTPKRMSGFFDRTYGLLASRVSPSRLLEP